MKLKWKTGIGLLSAFIFLLWGCQGKEEGESYQGELSKAQEIVVTPSGSTEEREVLTEKKEIEAFVSALELEGWILKSIPENKEKIGDFTLFQEETIKAGETEKEDELQEIGRLCLYQGNYVEMELGGIGMEFQISEKAGEYLGEYFE